MLTLPDLKNPKPGKNYDSKGLYLFVTATGVKSWRWRYRLRVERYAGTKSEKPQIKLREFEVVLGQYPQLGLTAAREARDRQAEMLEAGKDPATAKRVAKQAAQLAVTKEIDSSFKKVAERWYERNADTWRDSYRDNVRARLETYLYPRLGKTPIRDLTPPVILAALEAIERNGAREVAHRCRRYVSAICRYAITVGMLDSDPARDLGDALKPLREAKPRPAIIVPHEFGKLLRDIDHYKGSDALKLALQIIALTVPRPGELRKALWQNVSLHTGVWVIPAADAKQNREHKIPLSRQALAYFRALYEINGNADKCFPGMSDAALSVGLKRMGYPGDMHCPHGFRASFSSICQARGKIAPEVIEKALAHIDPNEVRRAYARHDYWKERVKLMQSWADHCDRLKERAVLLY